MRWWVAVAALGLLGLAGCDLHRPRIEPAPRYDEAFFARKPFPIWVVPKPTPGTRSDTVVGELRTVVVRPGDTLLDLARLHGLGYEEMVAANPGVDPWLPPPGTRVLLPTAFVLPCCRYDGIVLNVPEMRLWFFETGPTPDTIRVRTFPVGLGRAEFPTPTGTFRIAGKTERPTWHVPERIRRERLRERGDARRSIPGGDPDNPLGAYRFELNRTLYRIHGTNFPWGVGRQVSHGCAQLYPEDMEHLFPLVAVGTPVAFVHQPVKVGRRDGDVWIEVHRDLYRRGGVDLMTLRKALWAEGVVVDADRLRAALRLGDGVPRPLGRIVSTAGERNAGRKGPPETDSSAARAVVFPDPGR